MYLPLRTGAFVFLGVAFALMGDLRPGAASDAVAEHGTAAESASRFAFLERPDLSRRPSRLRKWEFLQIRMEDERRRVVACVLHMPCRDIQARSYAALLARLRHKPRREQVDEVNRHFNQFPYVPDYTDADVRDIWRSPFLFIQTSGDCEDFAIAKYFVLRLLQVPEEDLRFLLVHDDRRRADHAVLLVHTEAGVAVLDNLTNGLSLDELAHYRPLMTFNALESWRIGPERPAVPSGGAALDVLNGAAALDVPAN